MIIKKNRGENLKTKNYIKQLKENYVRISEKQEKALLEYFGENIDNEFTDQDIAEQARKVIDKA